MPRIKNEKLFKGGRTSQVQDQYNAEDNIVEQYECENSGTKVKFRKEELQTRSRTSVNRIPPSQNVAANECCYCLLQNLTICSMEGCVTTFHHMCAIEAHGEDYDNLCVKH